MPELLPLTHLEQYIYFMHCPSHPWIGHMRLIFEGRIEAPRLEDAVRTTLKKHPLLSSKIIKKKDKLFWVIPKDPALKIHLLETSETTDYPQVADIDLENETGLKMFLKNTDHQSVIYLQAHHACCDGQGISFFLEDLFIAYDALCQNKATPNTPFDLSYLKDRAKLKLPLIKRYQLLCKQLPGLAATALMLLRKRQGISTTPIPSRDTPISTPNHCERRLDQALTKEIALAAKQLKVTGNDLMLRELMIAIGEWKKANGYQDDGSWFRMMIPISLRNRKDYNQTAINKFSMVMIERQHKAMLKPERLLERIQEDMNAIKRLELGYTFILLLKLASWIPGGIRRLAHSNLFASSTVFSNLGKLYQRCPLPKESGCLIVGPVRLTQVDALAVVSYPQCASFIVSQYAGAMNINMNYNPNALTQEQSNQIMGRFFDRLKAAGNRQSRNIEQGKTIQTP